MSSFSKSARRELAFQCIVLGLLGLFSMTVLPGCACFTGKTAAQKKKEEEEKKKKEEEEKKKKKPDFEFQKLTVLPSDERNTYVKPGHWMTTSQQMIANNYPFLGELHTAVADQNGNPLDVERTDFEMTMMRPAPMAKGQLKPFENVYYIPRSTGAARTKVWLKSDLRMRGGGRGIGEGASMPTSILAPHEYYFVALAAQPAAYSYLTKLDSLRPKSDDLSGDKLLFYRVMTPKLEQRAPVPSHPLSWSTVAFVLWDSVKPNQMMPDQKEALIDWLHFGGQLIISGPRSVDTLAGDFLEDYLPAQAVETRPLPQEAFDELNKNWTLAERENGKRAPLTVVPEKPPLGIELKLNEGGEFVEGTGQLVAERRIGRGRIVMTAFSLADRQVTNWANYDGFFNGVLMRRPRRKFKEESEFFTVKPTFPDYSTSGKSPNIATTLRYFSRDAGHIVGTRQPTPTPTPTPAQEYDRFGNPIKTEPERFPGDEAVGKDAPENEMFFGGYTASAQSGMAGWNDFSGASDSARGSLKDAAGISIPKAGFVLRVLAIYLVVLVPLNWIVFRLIGKVEWAWIAALVIAVAGAVIVVRVAQLDIGFARSRTEIAVLEAHGGYHRGHLTRYSALYTSLGTTYDVHFEDRSALAQPFSVDPTYVRRQGWPAKPVSLTREKGISLSGFHVPSNSTGMLHSEQMFSLGGSYLLTGDEETGFVVENNTKYRMKDAAVLRRNEEGMVEIAWIGELNAGVKTPLTFKASPGNSLRADKWDENPVTTSTQRQVAQLLDRIGAYANGRQSRDVTLEDLAKEPDLVEQFERADRDLSGTLNPEEMQVCARLARSGQVTLGRLIDLATSRIALRKNELRLVGWDDAPLPGMQFQPVASQVQLRTLFVVHLKHSALPKPAVDVNMRIDVESEQPTETDPDAELFPRDSILPGTDAGEESE